VTASAVMAWLGEHAIGAASLITALVALWRFAAVPVKRMNERLRGMDEDLADLLWDRLEQEHEEAVRRGSCSSSQKRRLVVMHRRYAARGRNHLANTYEQDILALPERKEHDK